MAKKARRPAGTDAIQVDFYGFAIPIHYDTTAKRFARKRTRRNYKDVKSPRDGEALARLIETHIAALDKAPGDRATVNWLIEHRVLPPEHAAQIRGESLGTARGEPTITAAFEAHPSTVREKARRKRDYNRYKGELARFTKWNGGRDRLADLTAERVAAYIEYLRDVPLAFDSRNHALRPLRRASRVAPRFGKRDYLTGFPLDRRDAARSEHRRETYTPEELIRLLAALDGMVDRRAVVTIALMACCGLRPSEAMAARVGDLKDGVLSTGKKTASSHREIPVPATVAGWVRDLETGRKPGAALISSACRWRAGYPIDFRNLKMIYPKWLAAVGHTSREGVDPKEPDRKRYLPPGHLRKTFVDLAVWHLDLNERIVDGYLGRPIQGLTDVTTRNYLGKAPLERMRRVSEAFEGLLVGGLSQQNVTADRKKA